MYIKVERQTHFLKLLRNREFAQKYFSDKDIHHEFNNQRLLELKSRLKETESPSISELVEISENFKGLKHYEAMMSLMMLPRMQDSTIATKKETKKLKIFESDLAYLIISDKISIEDCGSLGFNVDYLRKLLDYYINQIKNPVIRYYYDEKTEQISKITEGVEDTFDGIDKTISYRIDKTIPYRINTPCLKSEDRDQGPQLYKKMKA